MLFANFILRNKKMVTSTKEAALVVFPLSLISSSKKMTVAKVELASGNSVSEEKPTLLVNANS